MIGLCADCTIGSLDFSSMKSVSRHEVWNAQCRN